MAGRGEKGGGGGKEVAWEGRPCRRPPPPLIVSSDARWGGATGGGGAKDASQPGHTHAASRAGRRPRSCRRSRKRERAPPARDARSAGRACLLDFILNRRCGGRPVLAEVANPTAAPETRARRTCAKEEVAPGRRTTGSRGASARRAPATECGGPRAWPLRFVGEGETGRGAPSALGAAHGIPAAPAAGGVPVRDRRRRPLRMWEPAWRQGWARRRHSATASLSWAAASGGGSRAHSRPPRFCRQRIRHPVAQMPGACAAGTSLSRRGGGEGWGTMRDGGLDWHRKRGRRGGNVGQGGDEGRRSSARGGGSIQCSRSTDTGQEQRAATGAVQRGGPGSVVSGGGGRGGRGTGGERGWGFGAGISWRRADRRRVDHAKAVSSWRLGAIAVRGGGGGRSWRLPSAGDGSRGYTSTLPPHSCRPRPLPTASALRLGTGTKHALYTWLFRAHRSTLCLQK